ncbi:endonuclease/exonuclease/phosphatase family protein [Bdellovibrio reynosensis]|uniref:Endonuclease/exonuclease/phosphatase family protein n=1 Tax=Bdellovibrio reynosensis TaxID=2835041 RepID=A0ABY4C6X2_9BACT|nr:endonuclease/exonuclease/phosphatase family protein [Bdellovibrio reynosensis]UOF00702.1 endonuclease/exonuclease/phosphatase family protein [Bdellovibrio reynosensis]
MMIKGWILCLLLLCCVQSQAKIHIPSDKNVLSEFGTCKPDYLPANFQISVWNIKKGSEGARWARDFTSLVQRSNLVLIQESMLDAFVPAIALNQKGFCWNFATSFIDNDNNPTGVMSGGRIKALSVHYLRSPGREPILNTPKMTLIEEYAIANHPQTLLIANIHALNFVSNETNREHIDQAADYLKKHKGPMIFAGDFNTWNGNRLSATDAIMNYLKLKKVVLKNDSRGRKLDHIYIRGFDTLEAEILNDVDSSDHKPLTAVLRLK